MTHTYIPTTYTNHTRIINDSLDVTAYIQISDAMILAALMEYEFTPWHPYLSAQYIEWVNGMDDMVNISQ